MQRNVEDAIEALQKSLAVLELANKAGHLMEEKKYYSALKVSRQNEAARAISLNNRGH